MVVSDTHDLSTRGKDVSHDLWGPNSGLTAKRRVLKNQQGVMVGFDVILSQIKTT